jgi:hypothetical protein
MGITTLPSKQIRENMRPFSGAKGKDDEADCCWWKEEHAIAKQTAFLAPVPHRCELGGRSHHWITMYLGHTSCHQPGPFLRHRCWGCTCASKPPRSMLARFAGARRGNRKTAICICLGTSISCHITPWQELQSLSIYRRGNTRIGHTLPNFTKRKA